MSEYQRYEFLALDRPLTAKEMAELRKVSTRADISSTRFWNEYHWGDLSADPARLLARYFDAFFHVANWGFHRMTFRFPASRVPMARWKPYFPGGSATLSKRGGFVLVDLTGDEAEPEDERVDDAGTARLTPLRAQLLGGDLAAAYLCWLLAVQTGDVAGSTREPPVPTGLGRLSAPLAAMVDFLHLDPDLVAAAAEASAGGAFEPRAVRAWLASLPTRQKDRWLSKAVASPDAPIGGELIAAFRQQDSPKSESKRSVNDLLQRADEIRLQREERERREAEVARHEAAAARRRRLATLARRGNEAWKPLEQLLTDRAYEEAVRLTVDLRDAARLAKRDGEFDARLASLRQSFGRRRGYWTALKRALAEPGA